MVQAPLSRTSLFVDNKSQLKIFLGYISSSSKPRIVEVMNQQNAMENIHLENLSLSEEQMEQLYSEFTRRFRLEEMSRRETRDREEVPPEIFEELENSPKIDLSNNLKKFAKDTKRFEGGEWTAAETINKGFIPDLKKYTIDSLQAVSYKYKDADRLRVAGHAATEIFRELQFITNNEEERAERVSDEEIILTCIEKLRRLAIFSYATSKRIDQEARSIAAKGPPITWYNQTHRRWRRIR